MRTFVLSLSMLAGLCSAPSNVAAQDAGTCNLLGTSKMDAGATYVPVKPVGIGPGWRGWGWYPSASRPVAPYYGTANQVYGYRPTGVREFNYYHRGANVNIHPQ